MAPLSAFSKLCDDEDTIATIYSRINRVSCTVPIIAPIISVILIIICEAIFTTIAFICVFIGGIYRAIVLSTIMIIDVFLAYVRLSKDRVHEKEHPSSEIF